MAAACSYTLTLGWTQLLGASLSSCSGRENCPHTSWSVQWMVGDQQQEEDRVGEGDELLQQTHGRRHAGTAAGEERTQMTTSLLHINMVQSTCIPELGRERTKNHTQPGETLAPAASHTAEFFIVRTCCTVSSTRHTQTRLYRPYCVLHATYN